jgi:uncharacterized protein YneF (UPF0154 family)
MLSVDTIFALNTVIIIVGSLAIGFVLGFFVRDRGVKP